MGRIPSCSFRRTISACPKRKQGCDGTAPPINTAQEGERKGSVVPVPIFKLPLFLYRLRLGWLFGKRFMLLTHVGRHSGKVRRTILAVLRFDEQTKEIYAVSAWKGSDWYSNIQAAPALQVETGFVRFVPVQRTLSPEEITTLFLDYRK